MNRSAATHSYSSPLRQRLLALLAGFACTLPVLANVILPTTPLQATTGVPANILFILDDSGSMAWKYLYNPNISAIASAAAGINSQATGDNTSVDSSYDTTSTSTDSMYDNSYVTNGLYYNPDNTYTPWYNANGSTQANASYTGVYTSDDFVSGGTLNLSSSAQNFYIPIPPSTGDGNALNYYRYQIRPSGAIYRSQLMQFSDASATTQTTLVNLSGQTAAHNVMLTPNSFSFTVPAGINYLVVNTSGGSGNSDLYVRFGSKPTTATYDCRSTSGNNTDSCTINNPAAGTWWIGLYGTGGSGFSGVNLTAVIDDIQGNTGVGCNDTNASGYDWRDCTQLTPSGRTEAAERQNFANWYSYYRTRIKAAKAGTSGAFTNLGFIPRVGYRTIHDRSNFDIPVTSDNGLFEDKAASGPDPAVTNKTTWFARLFGASASSGTPLRIALDNAGIYFKDSSATGPYGPEATASQISCRQNFTILTTDGYWNESFSGAGEQDNAAGGLISGPTPDNLGTRTYTYAPTNPYKGVTSNTLADVAMKYWKTDLRTDLTNNVPSSTPDPAWWQHMETFSISIGAQGTIAPTAATLAQITAGTLAWPVPVGNTLTTVDDLWHAAVNGRGTFLIASDPVAFVNGLRSALSAISVRTSSSSNVAANSTRLDTGTQVFQATFTTGRWSGDLTAFPVSAAGVGAIPTWVASTQVPVWTSRNIRTWNGSAGVAFPTAAQQTALGGSDGSDYLRGDQNKEVLQGGTLRDRSAPAGHAPLGDIDHSSPFFVAGDTTVSPNIPPMVYVGGNDGMLHAFNASTGVEVFAYVPGGLNFANLKAQQDPAYQHAYEVDGELVVSTQAQTPGKNILVGTLGRGGKTVYALDVSDPNNFGNTSVKWEFSDPDLGNVLGKPIVAQLNSGVTGVILGNGYNSATGRSMLFVLDINTGALIKKIDTMTGNTTTSSNGLASPKGWDNDRSGTVDQVYAGDLLGNVWKFDLSGSVGSWGSALMSSGTPQPLYTAKDALGNAQPITGGLSIGLEPSTFKRWIFFGTGRYLTTGDPGDKSVQSWYGLIDANANITSVTTRNSLVLKQRKIVVTTTVNGKTVRAFEQPTAGDMAGLKGWYVDLQNESTSPATAEGERIITDSTLIGSVLIASSIIPSNESCLVGGRGFINAIDPFTGGAVTSPFFDINGDGSFNSGDKVTDASGNSLSIGSVDLGVALPTMAAFIQKLLVAGGSSGGIGSIGVSNPTNSGRISWREILLGN